MKASIRDYGMTDHTTHDLAIARAERDAWQSTCEELHRAIAGRDVEIEAHLGRCEAADQRARSFEAALTAEREDNKGLVAQVEQLRGDLQWARSRVKCAGNVEDPCGWRGLGAAVLEWEDSGETPRCPNCDEGCVEIDHVAEAHPECVGNDVAELAAIRDLVAPGNPQGTVVDAVRARLDAVENAQAFGIRERDAAIARAEKAESDLAELTVTRDRLLAREHEDGRLHAQLRAELAELRARPVLTEDLLRGALDAHGYAGLTRKLFAHLGPVTLPLAELRARPVLTEERLRGALFACADGASDAEVRAILAALGPVMLPAQDRADELVSAWRGICTDSATCDLDPAERMRRALASLGAPPTSPPAARPVFAGVSEDELIRLFYVVGTDGIDHGEQCPPIDISDRNGIRAVLARLEVSLVTPVAPTLVAVSDEELAVAFYSEPERPALRECIDAADLAGIRAVRAKLGAAEVTEERVKAALKLLDGTTSSDDLTDDESLDDRVTFFMTSLRASAAKGG